METNQKRLVLGSVFARRGGGNGRTKLEAELTSWQRGVIDAAIILSPYELLVLGRVDENFDFLVVTTSRLIWRTNGLISEVLLGEIALVYIDFKEMRDRSITKDEVSWLDVKMRSGTVIRISVEGGASLVALWSVLNAGRKVGGDN